ncbi:MAG: hypothetical protein ABIP01_04145 [Candidatus Limnocylindria bacterium]
MTDQPPDDVRTAELEARIAELEHRLARGPSADANKSGVEAAFWATMHRIFPDEARKHLKVAGKEQLLAARVYLDRWIERIDHEKTEASERLHEKIDVE